MALVAYGPIVDDVAGSIADTTLQHSVGGNQARTKTRTCNPQTTKQLAARSNLITIAKLWQALTDAQKLAWKNTSKQHPYTNALGHQHTLPGFQFFVKINATKLADGTTFLTDPPPSFYVEPLTTAAALPVFTGSATTGLTAFWNRGVSSNSIVRLQATGRYTFGFTPDDHRLEEVDTISNGRTALQPEGAKWQTVYGTLPTQPPYKILFRFTPIGPANGWKGCPVNYLLAVDVPPPAAPPTPGTNCSSAPTIAAATPYHYTGNTGAPSWFLLPTVPTDVFTLAWMQSAPGGAPQVLVGTSCGSAIQLTHLAQQDAVHWYAKPGMHYWLQTSPWPAGTTFQFLFNPQTIQGPPAITSISPTSGPSAGGTLVTINGWNFDDAQEVDFGNSACHWFRVLSNWKIEAKSPPLTPGIYDITIHGQNGCSPTSTSDEWTTTNNPPAAGTGGVAWGGPGQQPEANVSTGGMGWGGHGEQPELLGTGGTGWGGPGQQPQLVGTGGIGIGGPSQQYEIKVGPGGPAWGGPGQNYERMAGPGGMAWGGPGQPPPSTPTIRQWGVLGGSVGPGVYTATWGPATLAGSTLVVGFHCDGPSTVTPPAGWITLETATNAGVTGYLFAALAAPSVLTSAFTLTGGGNICLVWTEIAGLNRNTVDLTGADSGATSPGTPTVGPLGPTATPYEIAIAFLGAEAAFLGAPPITGFTPIVSNFPSNFPWGQLAYLVLPSPQTVTAAVPTMAGFPLPFELFVATFQ
jgi:IPT/TIG domain